MIGLHHYLTLAAILFSLSVAGIFIPATESPTPETSFSNLATISPAGGRRVVGFGELVFSNKK